MPACKNTTVRGVKAHRNPEVQAGTYLTFHFQGVSKLLPLLNMPSSLLHDPSGCPGSFSSTLHGGVRQAAWFRDVQINGKNCFFLLFGQDKTVDGRAALHYSSTDPLLTDTHTQCLQNISTLRPGCYITPLILLLCVLIIPIAV